MQLGLFSSCAWLGITGRRSPRSGPQPLSIPGNAATNSPTAQEGFQQEIVSFASDVARKAKGLFTPARQRTGVVQFDVTSDAGNSILHTGNKASKTAWQQICRQSPQAHG